MKLRDDLLKIKNGVLSAKDAQILDGQKALHDATERAGRRRLPLAVEVGGTRGVSLESATANSSRRTKMEVEVCRAGGGARSRA